jgi:hypothetical protein
MQFRLGYNGLFGLLVELENHKYQNNARTNMLLSIDIKQYKTLNETHAVFKLPNHTHGDCIELFGMFDIGCQKHNVVIEFVGMRGFPAQQTIPVGLQWSVWFVC